MHPYHWDAGLEPKLARVAERVGRLRQARMPPAALESLRHWFRIHHTYHSNAIEGNRLTLPETRAVLENGITIAGKPLKDHLETVNLAHALDFIETLSKAEAPLSEREVRDMHAIVLRSIDVDNAGKYRRINVRIGGTDYAPPPAVAVPERMEAFGQWLASEKPESPIITAALAHTWFETIHPFVDGNGRTGRLLANLLLMRSGYPITVLRVEERARYYTALDHSHGGDLTPMVELTLETVERSLVEYERAVQEVEVREPAIEYLAERLAALQPTSAPEFLTWKYGVEALQGSLAETAARIREQLAERAPTIELQFRPNPVTEALWRESASGRRELGQIAAKSARTELLVYLLVEPPTQESEWLGPVRRILRVEAKEFPRDPEHIVLAIPDRHLFTAVYAAGRGSQAVGHLNLFDVGDFHLGDESEQTSSQPPPGVRVEHGVSALKIATDIWTYLIERHLT